MRYTPDIKRKALEMMASVGVNQTSEDMKITKNTLYKWRNEQKAIEAERAATATETAQEAQKAAVSDEMALQSAVIQRLEEENAALKDQNEKLKKALVALLG